MIALFGPPHADIVSKHFTEEDEIQIRENLDGEIGTEIRAFLQRVDNSAQGLDGGWLGGRNSSGYVVLEHDLPRCFHGADEGAVIQLLKGAGVVEIEVILAAWIGRSSVCVELREGLSARFFAGEPGFFSSWRVSLGAMGFYVVHEAFGVTGFVLSIIGSALCEMVGRVNVYVLKGIHGARLEVKNFGTSRHCMGGFVLNSVFIRMVKYSSG